MPPLTEVQQQKRRAGIGSSEIAAVVGEHPYRTVHDLWLLKRGLVDDFEGNDATWHGQVMEAPIAQRYSETTGRTVRKHGRTVRHPKHDVAVASPDYYVFSDETGHERLVEIKLVGHRVAHHWSASEADGAPPYVICQAQWQMGVTKVTRCDVAAFFVTDYGGPQWRIYELQFDQELFDVLIAKAKEFWRWVERGEAPPMDHTDSARDVLKSLYGFNRAPLKPAPAEAREWFDLRVEADKNVKHWEEKKKLAGNMLCQFIGDSDGIEADWGKVTWKATSAGQRVIKVYQPKLGKVAA